MSLEETLSLVKNNIGPLFTGGILTFIVTSYFNRRKLVDSLDTKSGWREKLFDTAAAEVITKKEIHILRTTLRYKAKEKSKKPFDILTNDIINFCDEMVKKKNLSNLEQEKARIYARYLLKHHWEENLRLIPPSINFCFKCDEVELFKETKELIENLKK